MATAPRTLFGRTSSSNTQKVLWVLHELGLEYEFVPASARLGPESELLGQGQVYGFPPGFEQLNPYFTVPTLQDGAEAALWESNSIVRYLASQSKTEADGSGMLLSATPASVAQCSMWMDRVCSEFHEANHHMIDQTARTSAEHMDRELVARFHEQYTSLLAPFESQLERSGGAYILGDQLTVADVPIGVEINRWSLCVHKACDRGMVDELAVPAFPNLRLYYARLMEKHPHYVSQVWAMEARHQGLNDHDEHEIVDVDVIAKLQQLPPPSLKP